jgi:hypothetical protein
MRSSRNIQNYFVFQSGHHRTAEAVKRLILDQIRRKTEPDELVEYTDIDPPLDLSAIEPSLITGGRDSKVKYFFDINVVTSDYRAGAGLIHDARLLKQNKIAKLYEHGPCSIYVTEPLDDGDGHALEITASRYMADRKKILALGREVK